MILCTHLDTYRRNNVHELLRSLPRTFMYRGVDLDAAMAKLEYTLMRINPLGLPSSLSQYSHRFFRSEQVMSDELILFINRITAYSVTPNCRSIIKRSKQDLVVRSKKFVNVVLANVQNVPCTQTLLKSTNLSVSYVILTMDRARTPSLKGFEKALFFTLAFGCG